MRGGVRVHISCTHLGQRAIGQQIFRGTNSIALFDQWTSPHVTILRQGVLSGE